MSLTPEKLTAWHAAYANDREPGAFERVLVQVWDAACEACAETAMTTSDHELGGSDPTETAGHMVQCGERCRTLKVSDAPDR